MEFIGMIILIVLATAVVAAIDAIKTAPILDIDDDGFIERNDEKM